VLFGNLDATSLLVEEYGFEANHPSQVGDHGVYFLHQKIDAPMFYRLVNSQGGFLDIGTGRLLALDDEAPWVRAIEAMSLAQLERAVQAAAVAVVRGEVAPAKPNLSR
jgi:hypothetical protein